jgi:hypothetical protein
VPGDPRLLAFQIQDFRAAPVAPSRLGVAWDDGFYPLERADTTSWRWCSGRGGLKIRNTSERTIATFIGMTLVTANSKDANLSIVGPDFSTTIRVKASGSPFSRQIEIPPGEYTIAFRSDAKPITPPGDPRILAFRLQDFHYDGALLAPHVIEAN